MNKLIITLLSAFLFVSGCKNASEKKFMAAAAPERQDTSLFYLDSIQIINYFNQHSQALDDEEKLKSFYEKRNYSFAWIRGEGFNEQAGNFINLFNQEERESGNDSVFFHDKLHTLFTVLSEEDYKFHSKDSITAEMELLLTINFFDYAKRNWASASNEELKKVSWFIEPRKINYENLLDTILKSDRNSLAAYEPVYRQYELLKKFLHQYDVIEKKGGWAALPFDNKKLKRGDTSPLVAEIKKQLYLRADLTTNDSTELFDEALSNALKMFQNRHGLKEDGTLNEKTLQELNVSVHDRIQQILINMERSRWVPAEMKGDYLGVNIPEFKLHVYHNDSLEWSCKAVVGRSKEVNNTVIFNDSLEYIVFSPYWNIPKTILLKETLPAEKRNPDYLSSHNMEVVNAKGKLIEGSSIDWKNYSTNFPYIIREKPGKNNSLGLVKFLFPNSYDIYLHDTPEKSLFDETTRTFSHGCIRIEEPFKLAKFLLRNDSRYSDEKIKALMDGGKETFVKMEAKVPVFIAYFTAWVDRSGKLNFRDDIYHHDDKMRQIMFN
ncbi:MAG: L,D-transpeptidase family protein [Bacteroidota bacterium]